MFRISPLPASPGRPAPTTILLLILIATLIATTARASTSITTSSTSKMTTTTSRHPKQNATNSQASLGHNIKIEPSRSSNVMITSDISTTTNKTNSSSSSASNGDRQAAESLLRPSFIRGLLKPHRLRPTGGEQGEGGGDEGEEEEEVTQTIMVPVNPDDPHDEHSLVQRGQVIAGKSRRLRPEAAAAAATTTTHDELREGPKVYTTSGVQPNAEASLRLTSTEIGGLLNDREAPEFYRERELGGDGVTLGEESPGHAASSSLASTDSSRLGMAASGQFGSQFMGGGGGGDFGPMSGGFDSAGDNAAALYRHRLAQAASEDAYGRGGGGGFNHRFGQQAFGGGDELDGAGGQFGNGGLMQSPNEYSEVNNYGGTGFMGGQQQQHFGGGDFSPHSGLLRAGSEGTYGAGGGGLGMMGGSGLDTAAAYGGGGEFSGHGGRGSEFAGQSGFFGGGGGGGRLQAHASFNPYIQSAAGEAEYASRFGQHQGGGMMGGGSSGFGLDQRGFASQNQFVSQRLQGAASGSSGGHNKLMPFTPVVPLADELAGVTQPSVLSSNQREVTHGASSHIMHQGGGGNGMLLQQQPTRAMNQQVHEALEDDPTDVSAAEESGGGGPSEHQQRQQALQQHYEGGGGDDEGVVATTMSSNQQDQFVRQTGGVGDHSLVLNVPPPPDEQQQQQQQVGSSRGRPQMVEFSRVGSAGYLGPNPSPNKAAGRDQRHNHLVLYKKSGHQYHQQVADQSEEGADPTISSADESSEVDTPSSGADNPAHAGKYIID